MTYDYDSLNAFLGVLNHFEIQKCGMRHLWGVPFIIQDKVVYAPLITERGRIAIKIDSPLVHGLCWMHKHSCLEYEKAIRPKRRPKFPSWSWAGWAGTIQHDSEHDKYSPPFSSWLEEIVLELDNGERASFEEIFLEPTHDQRFSYPKAILFNARIIPPEAFDFHPVFRDQLFRGDQWVICGIPAFVNISQGPSSMELLGLLRRQEFYGILLGLKDGIDRGQMPSAKVFILIVGLSGEVALRYGIMILYATDFGQVRPLLSLPERRFRLE